MEGKFIIKNNEKIGRYIVAGKSLRAGEIVFWETPFSYGPKIYSPLICLGCHYELTEPTLCNNCSWPVCNENCSELPIHKNNECKIFREASVRYNVEGDPSLQFQCICPLRTLLETERQKELWDTKFGTMEAHIEKRKLQEEMWAEEQVNVVEFLLNKCKLVPRFSEELIQKICGILTVNCYEIVHNASAALRGLYFHGGLLSHNCVANTIHSLTGEPDLKLIFRTTVEVPEGGELFSSYTLSMDPTMVRREKLLTTKYFLCECTRCSDPTELGTNLSTMKCTKCDNGIILSSNPLDPEAPWKCTLCDYGITAVGVQKINNVIQEELKALEYMEYTGERLEATEKAMKKYKSVLHPHHAWNVRFMQQLIQMYGRVEGYTLNMLPDILLERKAELCKRLMSILDIIEPGLTRTRGITLYEFHVALLLLNRSRFEYKELSIEQLKEAMRNVADILQEAASILSHEPKNSPEGSIAMAARESLITLQLSLDQLAEQALKEHENKKAEPPKKLETEV